jgi:hypothetical protein
MRHPVLLLALLSLLAPAAAGGAGTARLDRRNRPRRFGSGAAWRRDRGAQPGDGRGAEHGQRNDGAYRFPALPPGRYDVTAALRGFQGTKSTDVRLELGQLLKVVRVIRLQARFSF